MRLMITVWRTASGRWQAAFTDGAQEEAEGETPKDALLQLFRQSARKVDPLTIAAETPESSSRLRFSVGVAPQ